MNEICVLFMITNCKPIKTQVSSYFIKDKFVYKYNIKEKYINLKIIRMDISLLLRKQNKNKNNE